MSSSTHSVGHEPGHAQRVVEAVAAARCARAPGRRPSARSRRARPARWRRRRRAAPGCGPTSACGRRRACRRARPTSRPLARRWSSRSLIVPSTGRRCGRGGQSARAAARRAASCSHWPVGVERALAERGVDGEDLAVADVADGAGLGDLVAVDGERHVDVEHLARLGVRQVLGGRPDARAARSCPPWPRSPRRGRSRRTGSPPPVMTPGVTASDQRNGLWVGRRPRNERVSIAGGLYAPARPRRTRPRPRLPCRDDRLTHPWHGDACSLVDAFRRGERSPARGARRRRWPRSSARELNAVLATSTPRRRRQAAAAGRRVAAVRRRADRREGARPGRRLARRPRQRPARAARSATVDAHAWSPGCGPAGAVPVGPDHGERVRRRQRHPHRAPRRHPQPVAARPHAGRLVGRHRPRRWPAAWSRSPPAATAAARSASRPASPGSSA